MALLTFYGHSDDLLECDVSDGAVVFINEPVPADEIDADRFDGWALDLGEPGRFRVVGAYHRDGLWRFGIEPFPGEPHSSRDAEDMTDRAAVFKLHPNGYSIAMVIVVPDGTTIEPLPKAGDILGES